MFEVYLCKDSQLKSVTKIYFMASESSHNAFTMDGLVSNGLQRGINATENKVSN